jgi:hypothetical protein
LPSIDLELLLDVWNAAATAISYESMGAAFEEIVVVEIAEALHFRFLVLEMDVSELHLGLDT